MSTTTRDRAVVLGGSVAGLLAARVLADEYETVTMVERDRLAPASAHRRGVPQSHHVHALLPRGRAAAEELFPGFTTELVESGGRPGDILQNVRWYLNGQMLRKAHTGLTAVAASRPLIEAAIRRRVLGLPNVMLLDGHDIVGVASTVDGRRVTGARVTSLHGEGSRILPANLVVDCSGRGSRTPRWLVELGYRAPVEDKVNIDLTYASRLFTVPDHIFGDDLVVVTARFPGQLRGAVMLRQEGGQTLITLTGVRGERPPIESDGFAEFAKSLAVPDTYEAIRAGTPIGDAVPYRVPVYVRRRYEQLTDLPAGLMVAGDAVCAFNPVYGQGMSVAAATMLALREQLRGSADPDPVRFYQAVAPLLDAPWGIAVGSDVSLAGVVAPPMPPSPITPQYMANLQRGAVNDAELATALVRVNALIDHPSALLRPEIVERVDHMGAPVA